MANFVVVNGNNSGVGSLRQAVANANRSPGLDTISLSESVTLSSAINITDSVSIVGIGNTIITQTGEDILFNIDDGDRHSLSEVSFSGVSLTGGYGSAIFSQENLNILDAELFDNVAIDDYGSNAAIHIENATLNLERTSIYDNNGGVSSSLAQVKITDSNISNNRSDDFISQGSGINISNGSSLELVNSLVSNNVAFYMGGGIHIGYESQAEISNSTITGNISDYRGGGISISQDSSLELISSDITNNYALVQGGGIDVSYASQIEITNSVISGNTVEIGEGGGVSVYSDSQARITNSTIEDNAGSDGAGINARSDSSLKLSNSTITGNTSDYRGGGISISYNSYLDLASSTITDNTADSEGGGIFVYSSSQAEVTNSTISGNTAGFGDGGGINVSYNSQARITNGAIADNSASAGGGASVDYGSLLQFGDVSVTGNVAENRGGGIEVSQDSFLDLDNSTIADNIASFEGGGISVYSSSQAKISTSVITGNTALLEGGGGISSYGKTNKIVLIDTEVTDNSIDDLRGRGIEKIATHRIEAEDIANVEGYRLESRSIASGGKLLSLRSGKSEEVGKASFNFTGITGNYNVKIGTYDEDDGEATIQFDLEGDTVSSIVLDQNPGGMAVSANTKVTRIVATNVLIEAGDLLSFTGFERDEEHARIDFIELEPVGIYAATEGELSFFDNL